MKLSMTSLDIMVCVRELKNAIGDRVENVYEVDGSIVLRLHSREGGRKDLVIQPGCRVHLTTRVYRAPKQPTSFAMLLRKHLENAEISDVSQPDFERIVEISFAAGEGRVLIAELFGEGNIILCDSQKNIIQPYRIATWKHRSLKAGVPYLYPPGTGVDPFGLDADGLREKLKDAPDIVRGLAVNLGLGGPLAEEVCARAEVSKGVKPGELSEKELEAVLGALKGLLSAEPAPCIIYEGDKPVDFAPLDFKTHLGQKVKRFSSFNETLDEYFSTVAVMAASERRRKEYEKKVAGLLKRQQEQQQQFGELYQRSSEAKRKADLIAIHHLQINEARKMLDRLRRSKGWEGALEALQRSKEAGESWAQLIKSVDFKTGKMEVELAGQTIELDPRASAFENSARYYREYRELAEKAVGARTALEATERELEALRAGAPEVKVSPPPKRRTPKWFEHHRWFISSDGHLVIGGRDAKGNAEIIEKHMDPNDLYLHAEIIGAPHVVVKSAGKEIPETTIIEAAEFAAMHSRAWREGLGILDVYWAKPDQVSKKAPSGTYLPKGSYTIQGKRNLLKVPVRAAVGVMALDGENVVVCGPKSAVQKHAKVFVEIYPGPVKKSELARQIQVKFKIAGFDVPVDEIERVLPPGTGEIRE
ncbi:MAG: ribosome rescue protein RqcH [Candidatus Hadarchaeum sp.]|uniref:ribosome rescue protein RqcH n=1 Tax=Candidatus Hadarchaeum sp. TaxID=2883567 RepID=UPI003D0E2DF6